MFTWSRRSRNFVSNLCLIYLVSLVLCVIWYSMSMRYCVMPLGAPLSGFIYATGLRFTSVLVEYWLEPSFFVSKSIFESLLRSTSLMGQTRYTNPWVPKGHTHVSIRQGTPATRAFAIFSKSMICKMIVHDGAPECRVRRKVNKNRLLEEENLAFIGSGVIGAA
jgi:hypothetical protein